MATPPVQQLPHQWLSVGFAALSRYAPATDCLKQPVRPSAKRLSRCQLGHRRRPLTVPGAVRGISDVGQGRDRPRTPRLRPPAAGHSPYGCRRHAAHPTQIRLGTKTRRLAHHLRAEHGYLAAAWAAAGAALGVDRKRDASARRGRVRSEREQGRHVLGRGLEAEQVERGGCHVAEAWLLDRRVER